MDDKIPAVCRQGAPLLSVRRQSPGRLMPTTRTTAIATNAIPVNRSVRIRGTKWAAVRPI